MRAVDVGGSTEGAENRVAFGFVVTMSSVSIVSYCESSEAVLTLTLMVKRKAPAEKESVASVPMIGVAFGVVASCPVSTSSS